VLGKRGVATLWRGVAGGPSIDFSLGRVYEFMLQQVYKGYTKEYIRDNKLWQVKKEELYREKNCALIGNK